MCQLSLNKKMKILIIDDHVVVANGLKLILQSLFNPVEIFVATNNLEVSERKRNIVFDLIITDLNMPDINIMQFIENVRVNYPKTKIVVFSMNKESIFAPKLIQMGVRAYISKEADSETISIALKKVMAAELFFSNVFIENAKNKNPNPFDILSERELEILWFLVEEIKINDICKIMNLQKSTVSTHKANIMKKLGVVKIYEIRELADKYVRN